MDTKYSVRPLIARDAREILPLDSDSDSDLYDEAPAAEPPDRIVAGSPLAPMHPDARAIREAVGRDALDLARQSLDEAERHAGDGLHAADMARRAGGVHASLNGAYKFCAPFAGFVAGAVVGAVVGTVVGRQLTASHDGGEGPPVGAGVGIVTGILLGVAVQVGPSRVASYLERRYELQSAQSDGLALTSLAQAQAHVEVAVHAGVAQAGDALARFQQIRSQLPAGPDLPSDFVDVVVAAGEPADGPPAPLG